MFCQSLHGIHTLFVLLCFCRAVCWHYIRNSKRSYPMNLGHPDHGILRAKVEIHLAPVIAFVESYPLLAAFVQPTPR